MNLTNIVDLPWPKKKKNRLNCFWKRSGEKEQFIWRLCVYASNNSFEANVDGLDGACVCLCVCNYGLMRTEVKFKWLRAFSHHFFLSLCCWKCLRVFLCVYYNTWIAIFHSFGVLFSKQGKDKQQRQTVQLLYEKRFYFNFIYLFFWHFECLTDTHSNKERERLSHTHTHKVYVCLKCVKLCFDVCCESIRTHEISFVVLLFYFSFLHVQKKKKNHICRKHKSKLQNYFCWYSFWFWFSSNHNNTSTTIQFKRKMLWADNGLIEWNNFVVCDCQRIERK